MQSAVPTMTLQGPGLFPAMAESEPPSQSDHGGDESQTLMVRIASGDEAALSLLVNRWKIPLFRFFDRSLNNHADAEDLTQKVFIKLYDAAARYRPEAKFSTYLFTIARRLLLDEFKMRSRHPVDPTAPIELRHSPHARDERGEIEEMLEVCLACIPENHRTALLLRVQGELTYREISEVMDTSESAVKSWIFRARQEARNTLSELRSKSS